MAKYVHKFCFELLTPDAKVFSTDAVSVVLPASDGEIGILGGHAPLIAMLGAGRLTVEDEAGSQRQFFVAGGFSHIRDNAVTVLAEQCVPMEKLTTMAATEDLHRAQQMPADNPDASVRRQEALMAAKAKMRLARGHAGRAGAGA